MPLAVVLACSGHRNLKGSEGSKQLIEESGKSPAAAPFLLGPGDQITVFVWRHDELRREFKVDPAGYIYVPLAGEIRASGQTIPQLRQTVAEKLSRYIVNPQVEISISESVSRQVHVLGEVRSPGTLTLDREILVWEAIARAGGFTNGANKGDVLLLRDSGDELRVASLSLDVRKMLDKGKLDHNVHLKSGDIIYIFPSTIADIETFMLRFQNILAPIVTLERMLILWPALVDALKGVKGEGVVVPP